MRTLDFDIERMITLRVEGWSFSALGREFGKDHTTMMYHCKRLRVPSPETVRVMQRRGDGDIVIRTIKAVRVIPPEPKRYRYDDILEEKTPPARSYKSYLKEALARPVEKQYYKTYYQTPLTPGDERRLRTHGNIVA